jgi:predicted PurR-regulated permease PerM
MDQPTKTPAPASSPRPGAPSPAVSPNTAPAGRWLRTSGWQSLDVLRAAALVIGLYLLLQLLWLAHDLFFITFLGILFGLAVGRGADFLQRLRIPRGVGAALVVLGFLGVIFGLGAWAAPTLRAQTGELRTLLPQALNRVETWIDQHQDGFLGQIMPTAAPGQEAGVAAPPGQSPVPGAEGPARPTPTRPPGEGRSRGALRGLPKDFSGQLGAATRYLFSFLSSTVAVVAGLLLILFTSIYIGAEPDLYYKGLLHLFPHQARPRAAEVLAAISSTLRKWLLAQLIMMVTIGVIDAVGLSLLGVKAALALGLIAGLLEFIPMLGPILSAVPAIAMAFLDSPQKALFVALLCWAVQFLEGHILAPLLMKRGVDLPPVVTLIGLSLMALVFGFLGMMVAVPILAVVMVTIKMLYVEDVVGDDIQVLDSPESPVPPTRPAHPAV